MTITNTNQAMEYAKTAGNAFVSAEKNDAKGEAYAIAALVASWDSFELSYTVERKKDEYDAPVTILVSQVMDKTFNRDGTEDKKATGARKLALAKQLFGIEEPSNAHLSKINRALMAARYLVHHKADVTIKAGKLTIPYGLVEAAPKDNASSKAKLQYEMMKDKPVSLDGKEGMSLSALRARATAQFPVNKRASRTNTKDTGTTLVASIKLVRATLESQLADNGESNVALTDSLRRELYMLTQSAAAYFAADPIGDIEDNAAVNF